MQIAVHSQRIIQTQAGCTMRGEVASVSTASPMSRTNRMNTAALLCLLQACEDFRGTFSQQG